MKASTLSMKRVAITLFAALALIGSNTFSSANLDALYTPDTDIALSFDIDALENSPIIQKLTEGKGVMSSLFSQNEEGYAQFQEITGLSREDFGKAIMALDSSKIDVTGGREMPPILMGVSLKKSVDPDKVEQYLRESAKSETESVDPESIVRSEEEGGTLIQGTTKPAEGQNPEPLAFALPKGQNAIFVGQPELAKAALKRSQSGASAAPEAIEQARGLLNEGSAFQLVTGRPKAMEKALADAKAQGQGANPAFQALEGLTHIAFGMKGTDTLDSQLVLNFQEASQATIMSALMNQGLLMAGAMITSSAGEAGAPAWVQGLATKVDGSKTALNLSLTEADIEQLQTLLPALAMNLALMQGGAGAGAE